MNILLFYAFERRGLNPKKSFGNAYAYFDKCLVKFSSDLCAPRWWEVFGYKRDWNKE
jgi:hypothetical protein